MCWSENIIFNISWRWEYTAPRRHSFIIQKYGFAIWLHCIIIPLPRMVNWPHIFPECFRHIVASTLNQFNLIQFTKRVRQTHVLPYLLHCPHANYKRIYARNDLGSEKWSTGNTIARAIYNYLGAMILHCALFVEHTTIHHGAPLLPWKCCVKWFKVASRIYIKCICLMRMWQITCGAGRTSGIFSLSKVLPL